MIENQVKGLLKEFAKLEIAQKNIRDIIRRLRNGEKVKTKWENGVIFIIKNSPETLARVLLEKLDLELTEAELSAHIIVIEKADELAKRAQKRGDFNSQILFYFIKALIINLFLKKLPLISSIKEWDVIKDLFTVQIKLGKRKFIFHLPAKDLFIKTG